MKEINNRADVFQLVSSFYESVRADTFIGPVFNGIIPENKWPAHIERLTDFWETNLFGIPKFKGNPAAVHQKVDHQMNYAIQQEHFGRWLQLWINTIDNSFEGACALKAKNAARKMATGLFLSMWNKKEN